LDFNNTYYSIQKTKMEKEKFSENLENKDEQASKIKIENQKWERKAWEALPNDIREVVIDAIKYLRGDEIGEYEIIGANFKKINEYHAEVKLRSDDGIGYLDWTIKLQKYMSKSRWKFFSVDTKGVADSGYDPEEE